MTFSRDLDPTSIRKTPLVLSGLLLDTLKIYFQNNPGQFQWDNDAVRTRLVIKHAQEWDGNVVQKRPSCLVKRGTLRYQRVAIDDLHQVSQPEDAVDYSVIGSGAFIIYCVCEEVGVVERLAEEVSGMLLAYAPSMRERFAFQKFQLTQVGEVGILKEHVTSFAVPLVLEFQFAETWTIIHSRLKVNEIAFEFVTQASATLEGTAFGDLVFGGGYFGG